MSSPCELEAAKVGGFVGGGGKGGLGGGVGTGGGDGGVLGVGETGGGGGGDEGDGESGGGGGVYSYTCTCMWPAMR